MSATSATSPGSWQLKLAYQPIVCTVTCSGTTPVCYLDIYIQQVYYKTMASTTRTSGSAGTPIFEFDIRDALQEYLRTLVPNLRSQVPEQVNGGLVYCFVKGRGSSVNAFGYTVPEGPIPVQGTVDTAPVGGGGVKSPVTGNDSFIVLNGTLQLEQDPDAETYLSNNQLQPGRLDNVYNLFFNPKMWVQETDWMNLPVLFDHAAVNGGQSGSYAVTILAHYIDGRNIPFWLGVTHVLFSDTLYYLPAGPKNFEGLPPAVAVPPGTPTTPEWPKIEYYQIELELGNFANPPVRWKSPPIYVKHYQDQNRKRFRFVNWMGVYEFINFEKFEEEFKTASTSWAKYNQGNFTQRGKEEVGRMRYNVRSNELITAVGCFIESDMWFVKQFLSTPMAFEEKKGTAGQADYLLPIVLQDATIVSRKMEERWYYEITIQYEPANERINIRN